VTNKSRTAIYVIAVLFTVLALGMLFVPGSATPLVLVAAFVISVGLLGAADPRRQLSQLTVHDR
jgi:hypothetical protein